MKALISAFALLTFVAGTTLPVECYAQTTGGGQTMAPDSMTGTPPTTSTKKKKSSKSHHTKKKSKKPSSQTSSAKQKQYSSIHQQAMAAHHELMRHSLAGGQPVAD